MAGRRGVDAGTGAGRLCGAPRGRRWLSIKFLLTGPAGAGVALDWESRWGLWRGAGDSDRMRGSIMRSPGVEPGGGNGLVRIRHCAVCLFPARLALRWTLAAARTHHGAILPAGPAQWHKITAVELGPYHRPAESSCRLSSPF